MFVLYVISFLYVEILMSLFDNLKGTSYFFSSTNFVILNVGFVARN